MNRNIFVVIILAIIIVVLAIVLFLPKTGQAPSQNGATTSSGIEVSIPKSGELIKSPLKITGKVDGNGWTGFEGQVGTVKLLDDTGKVLAFGILTAQGEWMQQVINFETTLTFATPATAGGSLVFYNENPSGEAAKDKTFSLPVNFK